MTSVTISSTLLKYAMKTVKGYVRQVPAVTEYAQEAKKFSNTVVVILYERTDFFTSKCLNSLPQTLVSPVLSLTAGPRQGLEKLPENISVRFFTGHLKDVSFLGKYWMFFRLLFIDYRCI